MTAALIDQMRARGSWIPWIFVAGMLTVVAANGALIFFAFHSWSGVSTQRAYERGIQYNRVLDAAAREDLVGWEISVAVTSATAHQLIIEARDRAGRPLDGISLVVELVRPLESLPALPLDMTAKGRGRYAGSLEALPRAGQWDVRIAATRAGEVVHLQRRIVVP
jgi:nitrogen fixation protein FixH